MDERFVVFVNPGAREGRALERVQASLARVPKVARSSRVVSLNDLDAAASVIEQLDPEQIPVAAGGDGTINWLVRLLRERGKNGQTVAVIPLGTGNALAHSLGLKDPLDAVRVLEEPRAGRLDLMSTSIPTAPIALISCSLGFESSFIGHFSTQQASARLWSGIVGLTKSAGAYFQGVELILDGKPFVSSEQRIYNVGLYNLPCYAFGQVVFPNADPRDGKGEAIVCQSAGAYWRTLGQGIREDVWKDLTDPQTKQWSEAIVQSPVPVQMDGESVGAHEFTVQIEKGGLSILAPSGEPLVMSNLQKSRSRR